MTAPPPLSAKRVITGPDALAIGGGGSSGGGAGGGLKAGMNPTMANAAANAATAMQAIAVHDEYERLPAFMQQPAVLQHMAAMPHDATCLTPLFGRLVAAMVGAEGSPAR